MIDHSNDIIFGFYLILMIVVFLKYKREASKKVEKKLKNLEVEKVLKDIQSDLDPDRIYIVQFNASPTSPFNIHIKINNTYEICKSGILHRENTLQNLPLNTLHHLNKVLINKGRVIIPNINDNKDVDVKEDLLFFNGEDEDKKSVYIFKLEDSNNIILGFVGIEYYSSIRVLTSNEINIFQMHSFILSGLFSNIKV